MENPQLKSNTLGLQGTSTLRILYVNLLCCVRSAVLAVPMSDAEKQPTWYNTDLVYIFQTMWAVWMSGHASTTHDDNDLRACMYTCKGRNLQQLQAQARISLCITSVLTSLKLLFKQKQYTLRTKQSDLFRQTCIYLNLHSP